MTLRAVVADGLVAGAAAAVPSGLPSTLHALATGRDPMAAVRAAGSLLAPEGASGRRLAASAVVAHAAISLGWGVVLSLAVPRRAGAAWGAVGGLAIAALDLRVIGRRFPAIRALPLGPQLADHAAFGTIAGWVLQRRSAARRGG